MPSQHTKGVLLENALEGPDGVRKGGLNEEIIADPSDNSHLGDNVPVSLCYLALRLG